MCGGHKSEVGPISWRGKCHTHGVELQAQAIFQLANHSGPVFEYWRIRTAASVGAIMPESESQ